jgi:hypothetical protein
LKQAPRAWYERLRDFLLCKGFIMHNGQGWHHSFHQKD